MAKFKQFSFLNLDNDYDYVYYGFPGDEEEILHLSESNTVTTSSIVIRKNFPETWLWNEIANVRLTTWIVFCLLFAFDFGICRRNAFCSVENVRFHEIESKKFNPLKCLKLPKQKILLK